MTSYRSNRFTQVMEQYLTVVYESAEECMCACPFCEGKSSLGFNDAKGLWICFKCGEKGTAQSLVEKLDGVYTEPEVRLEQISAELRLLERDVQSVQKYLPESYLRRFSQPGRIHKHWRTRGFGAVTCDRWELGYDFLTDWLTLPFRDPFTGRLAGVIHRSLGGDGPRYQYPKGFARSTSLYGSWFMSGGDSRHAVLVEGPTDAISVSKAGVHGAAQYGSSIAQGQVRLLHRLGITSVTLFFDYDSAGISATAKAQEALADFTVDKVEWDRDRYCWRTVNCQCTREHRPDPGSLRTKEIDHMLGRTVGA